MKKIISFALAAMLIATMSVSAFAATINGDKGSVEVTYGVSESYTVTIPADITLSENGETDVEVKASSIVIGYGEHFVVSINSKNYNEGKWYLADTANAANKLNYTLKSGTDDVVNDDIILSVAAGTTGEQKVTLKAKLVDKAVHSGTYKDTITFTAQCIDGHINAVSMTPEQLKTAITQQLAFGITDFDITMSAKPNAAMFNALRRAFLCTEGVADGSIDLTLRGVQETPMMGDAPNLYYEDDTDTKIASVHLPDVTIIDFYAFYGCTNLTSVTAPNANRICGWAFYNTKLTTAEFPKAIYVYNEAFYGSPMTTLKLPSATWFYRSFSGCCLTHLELTAKGDYFCYQLLGAIDSDADADAADAAAANIDLVLNSDKKSEVINDNTWQGYTFKSITFVD